MTFSLVINHSPWRPERVACLHQMFLELALGSSERFFAGGQGPFATGPFMLNDADYRGTDWQISKVQWALDQWAWSTTRQATDWHVFMTDDLDLAPGFVPILKAVLEAAEHEDAIGFLSNHPRADAQQGHWYRTNSWLVGPCYALKHQTLVEFLDWFKALPDGPHTTEGTKAYRNDDSSINEFITRSGRSCVHPLPTIIEHRADIGSTTGHGDRYSRERISWRSVRTIAEGAWVSRPVSLPQGGTTERLVNDMQDPAWWGDPKDAPLLAVGE